MQGAHTQYKTVGVQWFASICFSFQLFQRWMRTRSENPTVSYCQPLCATAKNEKERLCLVDFFLRRSEFLFRF